MNDTFDPENERHREGRQESKPLTAGDKGDVVRYNKTIGAMITEHFQSCKDTDEDDTPTLPARLDGGILPVDIRCHDDAAMVVGQIQLYKDTADRYVAQATQILEQAKRKAAWFKTQAAFVEDMYKSKLEEWAKDNIHGKARSVKLITGQGGTEPAKMGFRSSQQRLKIVDSDKAIAWARQQDGIDDKLLNVTITTMPIAAAFTEYHATTGEIPDGCEIIPASDSFYIK